MHTASTRQPRCGKRRVRVIRSRTVAGLPAASTGLRHRPSLRCRCSHSRSTYRATMVTIAIAGTATKIHNLMLREVRAIPPSASTTVAMKSERPSRRNSSAPCPSTAGDHDRLTASAPSTSSSVPNARIPHFSCQLAASRTPKKFPMPATTTAVVTVSLVITVRRYRCSQSLAGRPTAPSASWPRADGNALTNPPCRTEPPRSPVVRRVRLALFLPLGRPPPPAPCRSSPRAAPACPRTTDWLCHRKVHSSPWYQQTPLPPT